MRTIIPNHQRHQYIDYEGKTVAHQIHVSIINVDDRIGVQVEDNGRGIPVKDIEHLFERFYRVDNSGSHDVGGSGIGLCNSEGDSGDARRCYQRYLDVRIWIDVYTEPAYRQNRFR